MQYIQRKKYIGTFASEKKTAGYEPVSHLFYRVEA